MNVGLSTESETVSQRDDDWLPGDHVTYTVKGVHG